MEKKQIIILIIIAAIYIFNAIRKMKAKADANNAPDHSPSTHDEYDDEYDHEYDHEYEERFETVKKETIPSKVIDPMVKKYQFIAETLESTSLETESLETIFDDKIIKNSPILGSQISDNENTNVNVISTEIEDVRKGFLYSEILKKKYN